ncbi:MULTISPECIES: hypothetical protein [unclassified Micromonospora]|uniref:hypothetical protein n=1 Tax=unclassified Micromonospora TaxID=2617518 RepID=UPI002415CD5C|nr:MULTISPECIES: hypothetical protein [unclassified Micromonospora]MDG4820190.1 hypothetical protein [Micromonospora sp. WMMD956]WFE56583.1 hypothetical protein O7633_06680 [Micromonospora sp. WMMD712]
MTSSMDTTSATTTGVLHSHGRIPWHHLAATLTGADGTAWADYDGFHIGAPPTSPPPYTHLWAWTTNWLLRARLDNDTAIVGVLHLDNATPPLEPQPVAVETIAYTIRHAHTWPALEKRIGPLDHTVTDRHADLYQTAGTHPTTFVRIR